MALRRCWRFTRVVQRVLWNSTVLPGASVPGGQSLVSNTHLCCKSEFYRCIDVLAYLLSMCVCQLVSSWLTIMFSSRLWIWHVCFASGTELLLRRFSSGPASTDVSYDQLKLLLAARKSVVIDVREPWELREYGFIPGAINVPRECCSA